ncbi:MAG: hypothetical protein HY721_18960, partial [Planctomycetes bacterium]|nr:hypothetical protein [Planctomycetota bacterium]
QGTLPWVRLASQLDLVPGHTVELEAPNDALDDESYFLARSVYAAKGSPNAGDLTAWILEPPRTSPPDDPAAVGPFLRGDCDGSGDVPGSINDAVASLQHCFLDKAVPCRAACDTTGDGNPCTGVTDGLRILLYVFGGGEPPPAPFPACDVSRRPEDLELGCEESGCH